MTLLGYLLGSLLPARWVVRRVRGRSPEELGENPGGNAAWRLAGPLAGMTVLLADMAKGALPLLLARLTGLEGWWLVPVAVAPTAGHNWPLYTRFRGGRGLAAALGTLFVLAPYEMVPAAALGALAALLTRRMPFVGYVGFPAGLLLLAFHGPTPRTVTALAVMVAVLLRQLGWGRSRSWGAMFR
ncbi:MAG: glycerol-3-phosphate acyltransferase [Clostridia bacterium]|nr:glycerol-3-phosphate acyltransferase [Clostridia bacterium]MCL6521704.1 glycerol-3-phosphate acyltransferase [Bacillota bacterium]